MIKNLDYHGYQVFEIALGCPGTVDPGSSMIALITGPTFKVYSLATSKLLDVQNDCSVSIYYKHL